MSIDTSLLFTISNALLTPVVVALLGLAAVTLTQLGGVVGESLARRRGQASLRKATALGGPIELDLLQLRAERALLPQKLAARMGPILGLTGTLIPLGPGLQAFATGDTTTLSESLVIAFSTTVVGLLVGGVSYCCYAVRRQWYSEDLHAVAIRQPSR